MQFLLVTVNLRLAICNIPNTNELKPKMSIDRGVEKEKMLLKTLNILRDFFYTTKVT